MTRPCPQFEPDLSAWLDGELEGAESKRMEAHLAACRACTRAVAQLRGVSTVLRRWDAHETRYAATTGFRNRVLSRLGTPAETSSSASAATGPAHASRGALFAWRAAAAAAALLAAVGGFALLAPRFTAQRPTEVARLEAQVRELQGVLQELARSGDASADRPIETGAAPERVGPLDPIIGPVPDEIDRGTAESPVHEAWEQDGDRQFLRDFARENEDFRREKSYLDLEESFRAFEHANRAARGTTAAPPPLTPLAAFLRRVEVSPANLPDREKVQVWAIELAASARSEAKPILRSDEAIRTQDLTVSESGAHGDDVVVLANRSTLPVLVLAGDILVGGRRDRVAREDVLVAPGQRRLTLPTYGSGDARGRSSYRTFGSSGVAPLQIRATLAADRALVHGGIDQAAFDVVVKKTVDALVSLQGLGSLDNLYRNPELAVRAGGYVKQFESRLAGERVVGFAVAAGSELLGLEVFGDHATFEQHRARLLHSYLLEAIARDRLEGAPPDRQAVAALLDTARKAVFQEPNWDDPSPLSYFRDASGDGTFGYGLLDGVRVVHAVVFAGVPRIGTPTAGRTGRRDVTPGAPETGPGGVDDPDRGSDQPAGGLEGR